MYSFAIGGLDLDDNELVDDLRIDSLLSVPAMPFGYRKDLPDCDHRHERAFWPGPKLVRFGDPSPAALPRRR